MAAETGSMDPERVGPYSVLRLLGRGGMGSVYLGLAPDSRAVAVKVIHPHIADDAGLQRLAREAVAMRRVHDRHVAELVDVDLSAQTPYLVTQYVPGRTLAEIVDTEGPLAAEPLDRLATGLARALTAIHAAGVVHRDLTPRNVLLSDGEPVVIDFGIVRVLDATRLTQGAPMGTYGYVAPEILHGHHGGPATDLFAWGATVAYAATGRHCFAGRTEPEILRRVLFDEPDLSGVPGAWRSRVEQALSKDPAQRPAAAELAAPPGTTLKLPDAYTRSIAATTIVDSPVPDKVQNNADSPGQDSSPAADDPAATAWDPPDTGDATRTVRDGVPPSSAAPELAPSSTGGEPSKAPAQSGLPAHEPPAPGARPIPLPPAQTGGASNEARPIPLPPAGGDADPGREGGGSPDGAVPRESSAPQSDEATAVQSPRHAAASARAATSEAGPDEAATALPGGGAAPGGSATGSAATVLSPIPAPAGRSARGAATRTEASGPSRVGDRHGAAPPPEPDAAPTVRSGGAATPAPATTRTPAPDTAPAAGPATPGSPKSAPESQGTSGAGDVTTVRSAGPAAGQGDQAASEPPGEGFDVDAATTVLPTAGAGGGHQAGGPVPGTGPDQPAGPGPRMPGGTMVLGPDEFGAMRGGPAHAGSAGAAPGRPSAGNAPDPRAETTRLRTGAAGDARAAGSGGAWSGGTAGGSGPDGARPASSPGGAVAGAAPVRVGPAVMVGAVTLVPFLLALTGLFTMVGACALAIAGDAVVVGFLLAVYRARPDVKVARAAAGRRRELAGQAGAAEAELAGLEAEHAGLADRHVAELKELDERAERLKAELAAETERIAEAAEERTAELERRLREFPDEQAALAEELARLQRDHMTAKLPRLEPGRVSGLAAYAVQQLAAVGIHTAADFTAVEITPQQFGPRLVSFRLVSGTRVQVDGIGESLAKRLQAWRDQQYWKAKRSQPTKLAGRQADAARRRRAEKLQALEEKRRQVEPQATAETAALKDRIAAGQTDIATGRRRSVVDLEQTRQDLERRIVIARSARDQAHAALARLYAEQPPTPQADDADSLAGFLRFVLQGR